MNANPQPKMPPNLTPKQLRERTNAGREANSQAILKALKTKIHTQDFNIPTTNEQTIQLRIYKPASSAKDATLPVFIFFHGGGYCFGALASEDGFCSWIAENEGIIVVNVCYRHTPDWKWPAQHEDAFSALSWVFDNIELVGGDGNRVLVGGRSSGSNLAAGVALHDKDVHGKGRIKGLILDLPHVVHTDAFPQELLAPCKSSYDENADAPILPLSTIRFFNELLDVKDTKDRYYSVLLAPEEDLAGFPSTHFLVAGRDPLRDEALLFEEKLRRAGVKTDVNVYPGVPHGFRRYGELEASQQYDKDLLEAFKWLLK
ncbi:Alpha/Beta hydrolase fold [Hyaloscypha variabilis]